MYRYTYIYKLHNKSNKSAEFDQKIWLLSDIREDLNKGNDVTYSWIDRISIIKKSIHSPLSLCMSSVQF